MLNDLSQLYAPTSENYIKANKSIRQAFFYSVECLNDGDYDGVDHWIEVFEKRVKFFCEKFDCTPEFLIQYF